jgi:hypothetical protein
MRGQYVQFRWQYKLMAKSRWHFIKTYCEFFYLMWINPRKRGNRFPTGPIWQRLTACHRMASSAAWVSTYPMGSNWGPRWIKQAFKKYDN